MMDSHSSWPDNATVTHVGNFVTRVGVDQTIAAWHWIDSELSDSFPKRVNQLLCTGFHGLKKQWWSILTSSLHKTKSHFKPGRLFYESLRGSMTNPPSTMALSKAATPPGANQTVRTAPSQPPATPVNKNFVTRDFNLVFHAFFPTPSLPVKFHPIPMMNNLFQTILKDELSYHT